MTKKNKTEYYYNMTLKEKKDYRYMLQQAEMYGGKPLGKRPKNKKHSFFCDSVK